MVVVSVQFAVRVLSGGVRLRQQLCKEGPGNYLRLRRKRVSYNTHLAAYRRAATDSFFVCLQVGLHVFPRVMLLRVVPDEDLSHRKVNRLRLQGRVSPAPTTHFRVSLSGTLGSRLTLLSTFLQRQRVLVREGGLRLRRQLCQEHDRPGQQVQLRGRPGQVRVQGRRLRVRVVPQVQGGGDWT